MSLRMLVGTDRLLGRGNVRRVDPCRSADDGFTAQPVRKSLNVNFAGIGANSVDHRPRDLLKGRFASRLFVS